MRKEEISVNVNSNYLGQLSITYPDEVVFVFNPLYIELQQHENYGEQTTYKISYAKLSVSTGMNDQDTKYEVDIRFYKGHAKIYISRLMELFFTDVRFERSKQLYVNLIVSGSVVWTEKFVCIWGNLAVGERFSHYGAFVLDMGKPSFVRKRIWFRNFPFTVSMFCRDWSTKDRTIKAKYDGKPYNTDLYIHYPPILAVIDSLENDESINGFPVEGEVAGAEACEGAVFDQQEKVFYGSSDDMCLYYDWEPYPPFMPGPEEYNSNGVARTDKVWAKQNGRLVRYDAQIGDLVEVPYGKSGQIGIFEVCPAITFPEAKRTATYHQRGEEVEVKTSTFDETFDYTFWLSSEMSTITELEIDNSTDGHYLRWIDRFGMYQYFLFSKGKITLKNKLGSNSVTEDYSVGGMYFANHQRTTSIEGTKTVKACATSLPDEIYGYVETIITSPIIDLYLGKTRFGVEMWVPVNIVAANHDYDSSQILHDLEISFTMPAINSQTL